MKRLFFFIFCIISALILSFGWYLKQPINTSSQGYYLIYESGTSTQQLVQKLTSAQIISANPYLNLTAFLFAHSKGLKAGEYWFSSGTSIFQLFWKISRGDVIKHKWTLVEGWTFSEAMASLDRLPMLRHTLTDLSSKQIAVRWHIPYPNLEGLLFPSTYEYTMGTSDEKLLKKAYNLMQNRWNLAWKARKSSDLSITPYEGLIIASLLEKETSLPQERPIIAAIILKRLKLKMPLQIDASVIYGLGSRYIANQLATQIHLPSVYNTYLNRGLPPTPIAMPSNSSLIAAFQPQMTSALYYVANGSGGHYFSDTYQQHLQAIQRYLQMEKEHGRFIYHP